MCGNLIKTMIDPGIDYIVYNQKSDRYKLGQMEKNCIILDIELNDIKIVQLCMGLNVLIMNFISI